VSGRRVKGYYLWRDCTDDDGNLMAISNGALVSDAITLCAEGSDAKMMLIWADPQHQPDALCSMDWVTARTFRVVLVALLREDVLTPERCEAIIRAQGYHEMTEEQAQAYFDSIPDEDPPLPIPLSTRVLQ
jgi:hypothetical protein